jgi:hypothetical protein
MLTSSRKRFRSGPAQLGGQGAESPIASSEPGREIARAAVGRGVRQRVVTAMAWLAVCGGLLLGGGFSQRVNAQTSTSRDDEVDTTVSLPLQVIHLGGAQRLQDKADVLFAAADQPEMSDGLAHWIETQLGGLKGLDRERPLGMMLYLKQGLSAGIAGISYFPATDVMQLVQTLAGSGGVTPVAGKNDRWELSNTGWSPPLVARQVGDYVFVAGRSDKDELDRTFPDPVRLTAGLAKRYDIAYSLMLKNIPPATKKLFLEFFKTSALAGLQQRDDEPDAAYRIRRSSGESLVDLLDKIVNQGEELTVGGFLDPDDQESVIELELNGTRDSKLAQFFQDIGSRRSQFTPLLGDVATMTISASWVLDEKQRQPFVDLFTYLPAAIDEDRQMRAERNEPRREDQFLEELVGSSEGLAVVQPLMQALLSSAQEGHLDFFAQLGGEEPGQYHLLAGSRVLGGEKFPTEFNELITYIREQGSLKLPLLKRVELNTHQAGEWPVHTIPLPEPGDDMGKIMFGPAPNLYLCPTPQALWIVVGGDNAIDVLEDAIRRVKSPPATPPKERADAPFQFITYSRRWVTAAEFDQQADVPDEDFLIVQKAFDDENDRLVVEGRPTDRGGRVRVELQSGYAKWLGQQLSRGLSQAFYGDEENE